MQFPNPAIIDLERGSEQYSDEFDFDVSDCTTAQQVEKAVRIALDDSKYETIIIDPISVYWSALQKKWSEIFLKRNTDGKGFKFEFYDFQVRDWSTIKADHAALMRLLTEADKHIVITARSKTKYSSEQGSFMKKMGETFDAEKTLPYLFDTVLHLRMQRGKVIATTEKDRTYSLPDDGPFECSFAKLAEAFALSNRVIAKRMAPKRRK